jgi:hypothetical protein
MLLAARYMSSGEQQRAGAGKEHPARRAACVADD